MVFKKTCDHLEKIIEDSSELGDFFEQKYLHQIFPTWAMGDAIEEISAHDYDESKNEEWFDFMFVVLTLRIRILCFFSIWLRIETKNSNKNKNQCALYN